MALQIWLPLNGDLNNQGLSNTSFTYQQNNSALSVNNTGKIGKCYERTVASSSDLIRSNSTITLDSDISMCCWAYVTEAGSSANGLITNHSHSDNTGVGITVKQISTSDYRISCNTGNGSNRTYNTYYGTTNIKDAWHHLALTYSKTDKKLQLWVDGKVEYTLSNYENASKADYFDIFNWSTTHYTNTDYRPVCKLNDVRVYDHCLSAREVKEISKGLMLHQKLAGMDSDCSGYRYDGVNSGTVITDSDTPRYSSSYKFTGSDYIKTNFSGTFSELSCSFWVKPNSSNGGYPIVASNYNSPGGGLWISTNCESSGLWFHAGGKHLKGISLLTNDVWYHACLTFNKGIVKWYLNGSLALSGDISSSQTALSISNLTIGNSYTGSSWNTKTYSKISDFRIYSTELSADDVKALYEVYASIDNKGNLYSYEFFENDEAFSMNNLGISSIGFEEDNSTVSIYETGEVKSNKITEY